MKVLSIDPGVTTGIAVVASGNKMLFSSWIKSVHPGRDDFAQHLAKIALDFDVDDVVIEKGPSRERNAGDFLALQDQVLMNTFPNATWMEPQEWKPTPRAKTMLPPNITIHEGDAIRMGREFLHQCERRLVGIAA